jgi:hypothetical protein
MAKESLLEKMIAAARARLTRRKREIFLAAHIKREKARDEPEKLAEITAWERQELRLAENVYETAISKLLEQQKSKVRTRPKGRKADFPAMPAWKRPMKRSKKPGFERYI